MLLVTGKIGIASISNQIIQDINKIILTPREIYNIEVLFLKKLKSHSREQGFIGGSVNYKSK